MNRLVEIASKFLAAANQASEIYKYLVENKGAGNFVTEVSMDEVESPQTPVYLLFILKMLADKGVPAQNHCTQIYRQVQIKALIIAVDLQQFAKEFEEDVLVIDYAVKDRSSCRVETDVHWEATNFHLSHHVRYFEKHDKGMHIKTASTTWLEEVIGLALAGGDALKRGQKDLCQFLQQARGALCSFLCRCDRH